MLRASAKNYLRVVSVCDPDDYRDLITEMRANKGSIGLHTRFRLFKKSFSHTAAYDAAISRHFAGVEAETIDTNYTVR